MTAGTRLRGHSMSSALLSLQGLSWRGGVQGEHPAYLPLQWRCVQGGLWARGTVRCASAHPPMTTPALLAREDVGVGLQTDSRGPGDHLQCLTHVVEW